ncbi:hypothetical protein ACHAXT_005339 [Thalassiosira profunda]
MSSQVAATRIVVQRFEDALRQIASLKKQNYELKEIIRGNEIKAMRLVDNANGEVEAQTALVTRLRGEIHERDRQERLKRERDFRDQSTCIEEEELASKEKELIAIIDLLEDEIQALKDDQVKQKEEFERQALVNQANIKQSFLQDIDAFRSQINDSVCEEVRDALADTIADNERLTNQFRLLLQEMERLQVSRDRKDRELARAKREMQFLAHRNHLLSDKLESQARSEERRRVRAEASMSSATSEQAVVGDEGREKRKAASGATLEEYFRRCIRDSSRRHSSQSRHSSRRSKRHYSSRVSF